jgi:hypothetical protein
LTIIAHDADAATERIVTYLSTFDVPVNVAFFRYFTDEGRKYLARTWLVRGTTVASKSGSVKKTKERWNGQDWYVSFGVDTTGIRIWADARRYGLLRVRRSPNPPQSSDKPASTTPTPNGSRCHAVCVTKSPPWCPPRADR